MLTYDPEWKDGVSIEQTYEHMSEIAHFIFDETLDNEGKHKNDLYFSDVNGIVNKISVPIKFGDRKKLSSRQREKVHSFCLLDHD